MKKRYLISYKPTKYQALNSGFSFDMTYEVHYLWGLVIKTETSIYSIPDHEPLSLFTDHWDDLIKNRNPIK